MTESMNAVVKQTGPKFWLWLVGSLVNKYVVAEEIFVFLGCSKGAWLFFEEKKKKKEGSRFNVEVCHYFLSFFPVTNIIIIFWVLYI